MIKSVIAAAVLSSFALVVAACSGSDSSPIAAAADTQAPPATTAAQATPPPVATTATPPSSAPTTTTLVADAGPVAPATIAKHCVVPATGNVLCLENVEGHVGDTVNLDVILLGSGTCNLAQELDGRLAIDPTMFDLMNPADVDNCRTRRFDTSLSGTGEELVWEAFGGHVAAGCDDLIPAGMHDSIQLTIKAGTAPGDYIIKWDTADVIAHDQTCSTFEPGMSGTIRVLP